MTTLANPPHSQHDQEMAGYYEAFRHFLKVDSAIDEVHKRRLQANRAQQKLLRLSPNQFYELATDVYDELQRRVNISHSDQEFLSPNEKLHPKRNQARKKLSLLSPQRFSDLAFDILFEIERRNPSVKRLSADNANSIHSDETHTQPQHLQNGNSGSAFYVDNHSSGFHPPDHSVHSPTNRYADHASSNPSLHDTAPPLGQLSMNRSHEPSAHPTNSSKPLTGNHTSTSTNSTYFSDQSGNGQDGSDISSPRSISHNGPGYDSHGNLDSHAFAPPEVKRAPLPAIKIPSYSSEDTARLPTPSNTHLQASVVTPTKSTLVEETDDDETSDDDSSNTRIDRSGGAFSDKADDPSPVSNFSNEHFNGGRNDLNMKAVGQESNNSMGSEPPLSIPVKNRGTPKPEANPTAIVTNKFLPGLEPGSMNQNFLHGKSSSIDRQIEQYQAALEDKDEQIQLLVEEGTRMDQTITKLETHIAESEALKDTLVEENGRLHQLVGEIELAKDNAISDLEKAKDDFSLQTEAIVADLEKKKQILAEMEAQNEKLKQQEAVLKVSGALGSPGSQVMVLQGKLLQQEKVSFMAFFIEDYGLTI